VQTIPGDVSPYLPIDCSWEAYLGQKDKKFRYKLRQRRKFVEQDPRCRLTWYRDPTDAERLLADIVQIEARSWKARAGIDIPSNPVELQYHRVLLPFLAQQGWLDANVLYIEDQPAAYNLCCSYKGWVGQLKTSFDEKFAELSPGTAVIDASIERAFGQQAREFDFLGDAGGHKLAWTSHTRTHADYFLYAPRLRPRLIGWLKTLKNRFRPSSDARRSISRGD
jgi:CelD/BcsL family acetyltransferase involved in cellulose biosynthesis